MTRLFVIGIVALTLCLGCGLTDSDDNTFDPACKTIVTLSNAAGLLHGSPCTSDADCMYGSCFKSPAVSFKICTKSCQCGALSDCNKTLNDADETKNNGLGYACTRPRDKDSVTDYHCLLWCQNVAECQKVDARYTKCEILPSSIDVSSGVRKVCMTD